MTERNWDEVRHFRREEWIHDPDRVAWDVVLLADQMREDSGCAINIHVAWDASGHEVDSSHYTNAAREFCTGFDFHFVGMSLFDQYLFAERYPWNGIGVYPFWNSPGLHCDLRRLGRDHPFMGKRWWRDDAGQYLSFDRRMFSILMLMPKERPNG